MLIEYVIWFAPGFVLTCLFAAAFGLWWFYNTGVVRPFTFGEVCGVCVTFAGLGFGLLWYLYDGGYLKYRNDAINEAERQTNNVKKELEEANVRISQLMSDLSSRDQMVSNERTKVSELAATLEVNSKACQGYREQNTFLSAAISDEQAKYATLYGHYQATKDGLSVCEERKAVDRKIQKIPCSEMAYENMQENWFIFGDEPSRVDGKYDLRISITGNPRKTDTVNVKILDHARDFYFDAKLNTMTCYQTPNYDILIEPERNPNNNYYTKYRTRAIR